MHYLDLRGESKISLRLMLVILLACAVGFPAHAQDLAKPVSIVENKSYSVHNRVELDFFLYDVSLLNVFVQHSYGAHLALTYHPLQWFALQAYGGYVFLHGETDLVQKIRMIQGGELSLPDLWETSWSAGGNLLWLPFYGKLSLFSEADANFQFYILGGAGVEGVQKIITPQVPFVETTRFAINAGLGLRLFVISHLAVVAEWKQSIFANPNEPWSTASWFQLGLGVLI